MCSISMRLYQIHTTKPYRQVLFFFLVQAYIHSPPLLNCQSLLLVLMTYLLLLQVQNLKFLCIVLPHIFYIANSGVLIFFNKHFRLLHGKSTITTEHIIISFFHSLSLPQNLKSGCFSINGLIISSIALCATSSEMKYGSKYFALPLHREFINHVLQSKS